MMSTLLVMPLTVQAAQEAENGDNTGFFAYRLATVLDSGTVTTFQYMALGGLFLIIASLLLVVSANKHNMPKSVPMVMFLAGMTLGSPRGCMEINARTFLKAETVQAVEVQANDTIRMNEDVY